MDAANTKPDIALINDERQAANTSDEDDDGWKVVTRRRINGYESGSFGSRSPSSQQPNLTGNGSNGSTSSSASKSMASIPFGQRPAVHEVCWFYNNRGCYRKDGSPKPETECRFLHVLLDPAEKLRMKKPSYLNPSGTAGGSVAGSNGLGTAPFTPTSKPCDKYNLNKRCAWGLTCKYSHRTLTMDEWRNHYPDMAYSPPTVISPTVSPPVLDTSVMSATSINAASTTSTAATTTRQPVMTPLPPPTTTKPNEPGINKDPTTPKAAELDTKQQATIPRSPPQPPTSEPDNVAAARQVQTPSQPQLSPSSQTQPTTPVRVVKTPPMAKRSHTHTHANNHHHHQHHQAQHHNISQSSSSGSTGSGSTRSMATRMNDLEARMSLLDFKFKCHDDHCERRLSILTNIVSHLFNDLLKNPGSHHDSSSTE